MYHVYVLRSLSTKRLYIGHTVHLDLRLEEHQRGKNHSTKGRGPWELVGNVSCETRSEAVRLENQLKKLKNPKRVLEFVLSAFYEDENSVSRTGGVDSNHVVATN